jgi:predicted small lipoprotein YifL
MIRALLSLIALAILMSGCGKYGPPMRAEPPTAIEESPEEEERGERQKP